MIKLTSFLQPTLFLYYDFSDIFSNTVFIKIFIRRLLLRSKETNVIVKGKFIIRKCMRTKHSKTRILS